MDFVILVMHIANLLKLKPLRLALSEQWLHICHKYVLLTFIGAIWKFSIQVNVDCSFLVVAMIVSKKILVVSGVLSLKVLLLYMLSVFVVDNMLCGGCLECPLTVTVNIGSCHWTNVAVSLGHLMK